MRGFVNLLMVLTREACRSNASYPEHMEVRRARLGCEFVGLRFDAKWTELESKHNEERDNEATDIGNVRM